MLWERLSAAIEREAHKESKIYATDDGQRTTHLPASLRLGLRLAFELVELLSQEPQMVSHLLCLLIT
jgi:hypothetical protein